MDQLNSSGINLHIIESHRQLQKVPLTCLDVDIEGVVVLPKHARFSVNWHRGLEY